MTTLLAHLDALPPTDRRAILARLSQAERAWIDAAATGTPYAPDPYAPDIAERCADPRALTPATRELLATIANAPPVRTATAGRSLFGAAAAWLRRA
ncbi:MAG TPA: hypothetical protein VFQ57_00935 [Sphingomonas sp.]|nr:hypothetical protein [Sphingomonas sp.]